MPKRKFYAIFNRDTHQKIVKDSWDEAQKFILGKNVAHKSFPDMANAQRFLTMQEMVGGDASSPTKTVPAEPAQTSPAKTAPRYDPEVMMIYTDGSHIKGTQRKGAGGVVYYRNEEFTFSVDPLDVAKYHEKASNPTMEMLAARYVLERLTEIWGNARKPRVRLHADYQGVPHYLTGRWKPIKPNGTPGVDDFRNEARALVDAAKPWKAALTALWVRGHSNDPGNDRADQMAGMYERVDQLDGLLALRDQ